MCACASLEKVVDSSTAWIQQNEHLGEDSLYDSDNILNSHLDFFELC